MITKPCDKCGKSFTSVHRTTCFICQPMKGPNREQLLAMAGLEDDGGSSCSVGGMATDLGVYPSTEDIERLTATNARLRELLRECIEWVPVVDLDCKRFDLYDRIKAELAEWE